MNEPHQFCTFFLDQTCFGVPVESVQEVLRSQVMTSVPLAPREIGGLINLRGQIVTVINMRRRLGLPDPQPLASGTHVIVQANDEVVSLLVDEMGNVQYVEASQFEPPPDTLQGVSRELITGTFKLPDRLLLVLDASRLTSLNETTKSNGL